MTRRGLFGMLTGAAAILLAGCGRRIEKFRYRVTVEVSTSNGLRAGSSVQEFEHAGRIPWLPGGDSFMTRIRGEAVAVDLGDDILFMLMQFDSDRLIECAIRYGRSTLPVEEAEIRKWPSTRVGLLRSLSKAGARIILDANPPPPYGLDAVPWMRFRDLNEPASFERVDPRDLSASFGRSVRLERLIISFGNETMTADLNRHLKWLNDVVYNEASPGGVGLPYELRGLKN